METVVSGYLEIEMQGTIYLFLSFFEAEAANFVQSVKNQNNEYKTLFKTQKYCLCMPKKVAKSMQIMKHSKQKFGVFTLTMTQRETVENRTETECYE